MSIAPAPASPSEPAGPDEHAFRSGRLGARPAKGAQAQLDNLARAGVVTHVVGHGEAIDPLFAVGQLRDLPEVRFVAAFREGVIALGCPDGLPEQLVDLAAPISVPAEPVDEGPPPQPDVQPVLASILDRLTALEGPSGLGAIQEKLSMLDTVGLETARLVGDLAHHAAELPQESQEEDLSALFNAPLEVFRADQSARTDKVIEALNDVSDRLKTVEGQIDAACEDAAKEAEAPAPVGQDLDPLLKTLPDLSAGLGRIENALSVAMQQGHARLDEVLTQLTQAAEAGTRGEAQDAPLASIQATLEEMRGQLEGEGTDPRVEEQGAVLTSIQASLDEVLTRLNAEGNDAQSESIAAALAALQDSTAERTTILAALAQVHESIEGLSARPDPVLDLTAQRQSFAQFGTVMNMVVQRLEGTAAQIKDSLETMNTPAADAPEGLNAQLADLPMALIDHLRESPEAASVMSHLATIKEQLTLLPETRDHLSKVSDTVEVLANRPKPVLDLTEQRRSFASFTTALATVVQRLEKSADRFGDIPDPASGESPLENLIAQLPDQLAAQMPQSLDVSAVAQELVKALPASPDLAPVLAALSALEDRIANPVDMAAPDLAPLEAQITELVRGQAGIPSALNTLEEQVSALRNAPTPALDTSEQRASFAMFSTALAAVVARLENAVGQIGTTGAESAESEVLLRSVHDAIASLCADTTRLENRFGAIEAVPSQIAKMQTSLEAQIAHQGVPEIDLTAQRQSLARFATAIQKVVQRLESVAGALPDQVDARDSAQYRPLLKKMRRLERQVAAIRTTQEDTTSNFAQFLERLAADDDGCPEVDPETAPDQGTEDNLQTPVVPLPASTTETPPDFTAATPPLDSLRFCFAEMIASQIRETAKGTPAPRG